MRRFDPTQLLRRLVALDRWHRTAIAASAAERLLPNYQRFVEEEGWGTPAVLEHSLDRAWVALVEQTALPPHELQELVAACQAAAPDTEDFSSEATSPALDACAATIATLRCLLDGSEQAAMDAVTSALDTAYMQAATIGGLDPNDPAFEARVYQQPRLQREMERIANDLDELEAVRAPSRDLALTLRRRSGPERSDPGT